MAGSHASKLKFFDDHDTASKSFDYSIFCLNTEYYKTKKISVKLNLAAFAHVVNKSWRIHDCAKSSKYPLNIIHLFIVW